MLKTSLDGTGQWLLCHVHEKYFHCKQGGNKYKIHMKWKHQTNFRNYTPINQSRDQWNNQPIVQPTTNQTINLSNHRISSQERRQSVNQSNNWTRPRRTCNFQLASLFFREQIRRPVATFQKILRIKRTLIVTFVCNIVSEYAEKGDCSRSCTHLVTAILQLTGWWLQRLSQRIHQLWKHDGIIQNTSKVWTFLPWNNSQRQRVPLLVDRDSPWKHKSSLSSDT